MPPRNYYEVNEESFLFKKEKSPEEYVRQWIIFELIGTYGYLINQIKIEVPVKFGTKMGYADIVIYKENLPFIVIECKRQENEKFEQHLAQAKSYAAGLGIKAEYSVYSNGDYWVVQRLLNNKWEDCLDIPNAKDISQGKDICELFSSFDSIRPLLYWRYKQISQEEIKNVIESIPNILYFYFTEGTNGKLLLGAGFLSVVVLEDKTDKYLEILYSSYREFNEYYLQNDIENVNWPLFQYRESFCINEIKEMTRIILAMFSKEIFYNSKGICNLDMAIIRFIVALLQHIERQIEEPDKIIDLDNNIANEFFSYLELALKINLNIELPDRLHKERVKELDRLCKF